MLAGRREDFQGKDENNQAPDVSQTEHFVDQLGSRSEGGIGVLGAVEEVLGVVAALTRRRRA